MSFFNLKEPADEIHGIHKGKWYVMAIVADGKARALLNDDSKTVEFVDMTMSEEDCTKFYFNDKTAAYAAMNAYYFVNTEAFPYTQQMSDAMIEDGYIVGIGSLAVEEEEATVQSQVMEF